MTSDTRRLSFCVLASLLINAAALVLAGRLWLSQPTPVMAVRPHIKMVTVALRRPPPRTVQPVITPHVKPIRPKPRPRKLIRPGTRVRASQPSPLAAPAGGSEAGAPALASPPAPAPLRVVTTQRPALRVVHNIIAPPSLNSAPALAPVTAPPPIVPGAPPAAAVGTGAGSSAPGKAAGTGEGAGKGHGAGSGTSPDAGEPFGVGQGMAGDGAPRHVVYVLDISGSMTSRIDRAEAELRHALNGLRPDETFNIVIFSDAVRTFDNGMAPATPDRVRQAEGFLSRLQVAGGTNLEGAMTQALSLPDVNEVVLLTDGVPTVGETDFHKLAREIRRLNSRHARISAVGMVGKNPDNTDDSFEAAQLLQEIARDSGGTAKVVTLGVATP